MLFLLFCISNIYLYNTVISIKVKIQPFVGNETSPSLCVSNMAKSILVLFQNESNLEDVKYIMSFLNSLSKIRIINYNK